MQTEFGSWTSYSLAVTFFYATVRVAASTRSCSPASVSSRFPLLTLSTGRQERELILLACLPIALAFRGKQVKDRPYGVDPHDLLAGGWVVPFSFRNLNKVHPL